MSQHINTGTSIGYTFRHSWVSFFSRPSKFPVIGVYHTRIVHVKEQPEIKISYS